MTQAHAVDDGKAVRDALARLLSQEGFMVGSRAGVEEFIEAGKRATASPTSRATFTGA